MPAISVIHAPTDIALGEKIATALSENGHVARRVDSDPTTGDLTLVDDDAAIVIWSMATRKLARLHQQARDALERGALIPIAVGGAAAPRGFETLPAVDLSGWSGDANDPRWRFVLEEIEIASQRQQIEDADVWASHDQAVENSPAEAELVAAPIVEADNIESLAVEYAPQANNDAPEISVQDAKVHFRLESDPQPIAHLSQPKSINPRTVFIAGGVSLAALTIAAVLIAPRLIAPPETTGALAEVALPGEDNEPVPGSAAFVQPLRSSDETVTEMASVSDVLAATEVPSSETVVSTQDAAPADSANIQSSAANIGEDKETGPTINGAAISDSSADADVIAGQTEEFSVDEDAAPEDITEPVSDEIALSTLTSPVEAEPALTDETVADEAEISSKPVSSIEDILRKQAIAAAETTPDNDAMENLIAAVNRGRAELSLTEPAVEPLPAELSEQAYLGNYFKECADCPDMAALPTGAFNMGAPASEPARRNSEGPLAPITISKRIAMGTREVTFAQWNACVADGGCRDYAPWDHGWGRGDRPVINVSFEDAQSYTAWLSQKTGETYRLPSEAEWEYAARGGSNSTFGFGNALSPDDANYNGEYSYLGKKGLFRKKTTPVASFAPNEFGLFDMHGNVWEWTADCWSDSHQGASPDGAPRSGDCATRVMRGGAWNTGGWRLRSAHRMGKVNTAREFDIGFRVVRELD